jgi:hypothetical protein
MKKWTPEQEQILIDLKYEGKPYTEIIKVLPFTQDACRKKHWLLLREKYENPLKFYEKIQYLTEMGYLQEEEENE